VLRNYCGVVELFNFRGMDGVFLYSIVGDSGVRETSLAQLLLPCPGEDAVECCAQPYVKDVQADRRFQGICSIIGGRYV